MQYKVEKRFHGGIPFTFYLTAPLIYAVVIPTLLMDLVIEIYHHICFPVYGLPIVQRSHYIVFDRQKLSYLRGWQKFNCMYCGYVNGLLQYAGAIAGETERFWCGILHAKPDMVVPPHQRKGFLPYGDQRAYEEFVAHGKDLHDPSA